MNKKILVTKAMLPPFEEYIAEIEDLWDSHFLTNMGEKHQKLEVALKEYLDIDELSLMVNGHMALELTLQALKLKGEVITTPFTFVSTTHAIVRNGLTPIFCDINAEDYTIDTNLIESLITERTCAIVPVHVYGHVCNVEEIERIARKHNLKVIYDAAHAFGESYKGVGIGNFGDASMFSFHATKVYNTIEGGAVSYRDKDLGINLYRLKNFGIRGLETVDHVGSNAKMNEFQAAMGLCNLRHIKEVIGARKQVINEYKKYLIDIPGLIFSKEQTDVVSNAAYLPIRVKKEKYGYSRDEVYEKLKRENVFARKYFYPLTTAFNCYEKKYDVNQTPIAKRISEEIITLPLSADLKCNEVKEICMLLKK
ncbi:DegT/DnrJ/EryC1/StrS family aminotransferase [Ohessyouella blattaphilus]|uniref:DegT/DnrJ/EryC1/StrS family aminotransferase n=1 Tax=Ohessyouella blattaphilus TaxID=2949333 RepID=A0ABT1EHF8_9FIRM|nr:DegT/DnrJ/EryC1/StrS family aminotransferase [Ohessyouella blattaphilus]MCP1110129.1 DegT/DnrJ/EryC1/StrS family aminotransferase [Ohessyouella blattaphilus]MCR8563523.1 DegT/DnrJ/EryC1/StrS family aminotransferase [Ohessyouella blattaphilus]